MKLGYEIGKRERDRNTFESAVVPFEGEEQILDYLLHKDKLAVVVYYYFPGHYLFDRMDKVFD